MENNTVNNQQSDLKGITFGEYQKSDYDGYIKCLKDFFHNGYPYTDYLQKESLHKMIDSGELIVVIAKNKEGVVVGTVAAHNISGSKGKSVHLMLRCIANGYKRRGIATYQEGYLLDLIHERFSDSRSIGAEVVTNKIYSQITLYNRGFVFCGMCFMVYKNQLLMPTLKFSENSRMSLAIYTYAFSHEPVKIWAPEKYKAEIKSYYDELTVPCSFFEDSFTENETKYHIVNYAAHQTAEIFIDKVGAFNDNLEADIERLLESGYTLNCFFDVSEQGCTSQYDFFGKLGFYYSGIKPLTENGELMIMANTYNQKTGFDEIVIPDDKKYIINFTVGDKG